jgi:hypothetical protein
MAVPVCQNMCLCTSERLAWLASWLTVGQMNGSVTTCMKGVGLTDGGLFRSFRS